MNNQNQITCPKCKTVIDVNTILSTKLEAQIALRLQKEFDEKREDLAIRFKKAEAKNLETQKKMVAYEEELKKKDAEIQRIINDSVQDLLVKEKTQLEDGLRKKIIAENEALINALKKDNQDASELIKKGQQLSVEHERLKREMMLQEEKIMLKAEKDFSQKIQAELARIKEEEDSRSKLKLAEKDMQIEQIKKQLEEATRKADQGSMQMQGEVQEIVLERELAALFPYDEILEVPKGVKGADCIQRVFDHSGHIVGSIIYESKRTKDFSNDWVEKLKHDRLHAQADIGIIITKTMPKGAKDIIQIDGIWICTFHVYKGLVLALRDSILRVGEAMHSQSNRGEKMHMLYDYLCSTEFKHQLEAVMEGFISMKESILREQMQMQKNWKEREKQIEKVLLNMSSFYGSVKGIAGSAIPTVKLLEGEE